jgi:hypothetical protein
MRRDRLRPTTSSQAFVQPRVQQSTTTSSLAPTQRVVEIDEYDNNAAVVATVGDDDDNTISIHSDSSDNVGARVRKLPRRAHLTPPSDSDDDDDDDDDNEAPGDILDLAVNRDGYQHASQINGESASLVILDNDDDDADVDLPDERDADSNSHVHSRGVIRIIHNKVDDDDNDDDLLLDGENAFHLASELDPTGGAEVTRKIEELIDANTDSGHQHRYTQSPERSQDADAAASQSLRRQQATPLLNNVVDTFDILPEELDVREMIEEGHYGRVNRAIWHGGTLVAVKVMKEFATTYNQLRRTLERLGRMYTDLDNNNNNADTDAVRELERKRDALVADASEMRKAFRREAEMLCRLRHPNVVLFVGACSELPDLMLVTEFVARGSLFHVLHRHNVVLDYATKLYMALGAACGVQYLHRCGILHRDLKSGNLLVSSDNTVKVSDFGLARFSRSFADGRKRQRVSVLDVRIQAPEVLRSGRKEYTVKSDVYSFALLLWELAERREPFRNLELAQLVNGVVKHRLRPTLPNNVRAEYSSLVEACWHHDAERRPTFDEIVRLLSLEKEIADRALQPIL